MKFVLAAAFLSLAHLASAQESAKSLFIDPMSGIVIPGQKPTEANHRSVSVPGAGRADTLHKVGFSPVTGVMYWIELQTPSGELLRVPANRPFRTGERIRIHVESNVDGQLSIMQSEDGSPFTLLFPAKQGMSNYVQHRQDKALPSPTTWFRFDSHPGDIRLLLMVQAAKASDDSVAAESQASNPNQPSAVAGNAVPNETQMRAEIERALGSKALMVESDTKEEPATYVVVKPQKSQAVTPGVLAVEVRLTHTS